MRFALAQKNKVMSLVLLSFVLPVGLLAAFRITGILKEPIAISETITLEAVKWEFQRPHPNQHVLVDDKLSSKYNSDGLSATLSLAISDYTTGSMNWVPPGDWIRFRITINAATANPNGFVDGVNTILRNDSRPSHVSLLRNYLKFTNLSISDIREERDPEAYTKAYVELTSQNHQSGIYFSAVGEWFLLDTSSDLTHKMEVVCELTYHNGTAYKKIVQPFQLNVVGR